MRVVYSLVWFMALPVVLLRLWWRARRQPEYLQHIAERFGYYPALTNCRPKLWLHAVSVGETRAAIPLIEVLLTRYPQHQLVLTHMTPTGRATGLALLGARVQQYYLPYDYPGAVARFVAHVQPQFGVLMETELWPNLLKACADQGVRMYLVNARLSERSARRYQQFVGLTRAMLSRFTAIAAQSEVDADRFQRLGASPVVVTGSLKFDVLIPATQLVVGRDWRRQWPARPVVVFASSREGEERLFLEAMTAHDLDQVLLVVVPRHPQRFEAVAQLITQAGWRIHRRSAITACPAEVQVIVGDTMGEMFAYYAASDVVILGGSFLPYGAQSLIEPCAVGKPVILGPSTFNFAEVTRQAVAAGAALQVADPAEAWRAARALLADRERCQQMAEAGAHYTESQRGATQRVLEIITECNP
jgi:3-deoxy-D-manno-octulosonic-acid transferase